jgi:hypothetical protein
MTVLTIVFNPLGKQFFDNPEKSYALKSSSTITIILDFDFCPCESKLEIYSSPDELDTALIRFPLHYTLPYLFIGLKSIRKQSSLATSKVDFDRVSNA